MSSEILHIGLSPCPNDTFICDALLHHKIDTEGLSFEPVFEDVETLNDMAFHAKLDCTKVSFHAFLYLAKTYVLLDAGAALGRGCGPLLIGKKTFTNEEIPPLTIAIPGRYTTANLLLSMAFPMATRKEPMLFSEIENAILQDRCDAGVIIHENRFTYQDKGLICHCDLGAFWETMTGLPIPLGGFIVNRLADDDLQQKLNRIMKRSVEFALAHPESSASFVAKHAQEMSKQVRDAHIGLYIGDFTRSLGEEGRNAVNTLFTEACKAGIDISVPHSFSSLYL